MGSAEWVLSGASPLCWALFHLDREGRCAVTGNTRASYPPKYGDRTLHSCADRSRLAGGVTRRRPKRGTAPFRTPNASRTPLGQRPGVAGQPHNSQPCAVEQPTAVRAQGGFLSTASPASPATPSTPPRQTEGTTSAGPHTPIDPHANAGHFLALPTIGSSFQLLHL